jgi:hypothetical protein
MPSVNASANISMRPWPSSQDRMSSSHFDPARDDFAGGDVNVLLQNRLEVGLRLVRVGAGQPNIEGLTPCSRCRDATV